MAEDEKRPDEQPFLKRWSQRKIEAREAQAAPPAKVEESPAPQLPPLEELTPQSDFSVFMHPKVDADVRRAALKKLFSDPHFNVMDGLDTYIDDYSKSDPLPPAMLAGLRQARKIIAWAQEKPADTAAQNDVPSAAAQPDDQPQDSAPELPDVQPAPEIQVAVPHADGARDPVSKS